LLSSNTVAQFLCFISILSKIIRNCAYGVVCRVCFLAGDVDVLLLVVLVYYLHHFDARTDDADQFVAPVVVESPVVVAGVVVVALLVVVAPLVVAPVE
jgi:hypothetical protein